MPPSGQAWIVGVDEAGCGALAGPVVAAAVVLGPRLPAGLDDSKKMSARARRRVCRAIMACASCYALAQASHEEIDRINILRARLLAMERALAQLSLPADACVMIDGTHLPDLDRPAQSVVGGDAVVPAISAASVLAKVHRDRLMERYQLRWPDYGFAGHKGYPTPAHKAAIARYGLCAAHRRSFKPCRLIAARRIPPTVPTVPAGDYD